MPTEASELKFLEYSLAATLLLTCVIVLVSYSLLQLKGRRVRRLQIQFARLQHVLTENQRRLQLLENHAVEYMHSLGGEAKHSYLLAKQIVIALTELVQTLDADLHLQDLGSILEAQELLNGRFTLKADAFNGVSNTFPQLPPLTADELETKLDELFEVVGRDISKASDFAYYELGTKPRERRFTIEHLVDAGIRLARNTRRRMTSAFKRPSVHGQ